MMGSWLLSGLATGAITAAAHAQLLTPSAGAWLAEHRVDLGSGVEVTSGPMLTFGIQSRFAGRLLASVELSGGTLSAKENAADRDIAELDIVTGYRAVSWLDVEVGFFTRTYSAALARQRWTALSLGGTVRLPFAAGGFAGVGRIAFLPVIAVSELASPAPALAAAAGIEYDVQGFTMGLSYAVERYAFPAQGGVLRSEQLSALRLRVAWHRGGRQAAPAPTQLPS
jgi:hypothetical protein